MRTDKGQEDSAPHKERVDHRLPDAAPAVVLELNLPKVLQETADALQQAAVETRDEIDREPRNLLAAFNRVSSHVDFFMRASNPMLHTVSAGNGTVGVIRQLRFEVAQLTSEVGKQLHCEKGFVEYESREASTDECETYLKAAATTIQQLAESFSVRRRDLILAVPDTDEISRNTSILSDSDTTV